MTTDLKHRSRSITDGRDQAPARAMYKAIGFTDADLAKPLIAVANTWIETMPCNFHLRRLSAKVKEGIRAAGGTPMEFNTIAISDGETMGTEGMKASLVSREVIADSIELVCRGQIFDAAVCIVGCDKTIPAAAMALARMNLPGLVLYGERSPPGKYQGKDVTIQDVFEAVGANAAGKMSDADLLALENVACPGAGACGGQYTANTMSTVMELIGLSPMGFNGIPAMDPRKDEAAFRCGEVVMNVLKKGIRPQRYSDTRRLSRMRSPALLPPAARPMRCSTVSDLARDGIAARHRRLPARQRTYASARRSQAGGKICCGGRRRSRRHSFNRQAPARRQIRQWFGNDRDRKDIRRRGERGEGDSGADGDRSVEQAAEDDRRPGDLERQSRPRRRGGQDERARAQFANRPGARLRFGRGGDAGRNQQARSRPETWW